MKIVTYRLKGTFRVRGIDFKQGVPVKVADNIGNYIKQTFPNSFFVEDVKEEKIEKVIKNDEIVKKDEKVEIKTRGKGKRKVVKDK